MNEYYTPPADIGAATRARSTKINEIIDTIDAGFDALPTNLADLKAEVIAARDSKASLLLKEQDQDTKITTVTNEVTAARDGKASLLAKEQDQDTNIATVTNEVTAARDGLGSLIDQINAIQADIVAVAAEVASEIGVPALVASGVLTNNGLVLEWAAKASEAEMRAGTVTAVRAMTPEGVAQAIESLAPAPTLVKETRTSNTILAAADRGKFIDVTSGTFSQTFTAAATLGAGWFVWYRNAGPGVITLDPDGSETIETSTLNTGDNVLIICTGTAFVTMRIDTIQIDSLVTLTSGTEWTCPAGVRAVRMMATGAGGGTPTGTTVDAGGGGGGTALAIFKVVPGTVYTYAIGAGAADSNGGDTTFTANSITYTGGGGAKSTTNDGGAGGTGSGTGARIIPGDFGQGQQIGVNNFPKGGGTHTGFGFGATASAAAGGDAGSDGGIILELYK